MSSVLTSKSSKEKEKGSKPQDTLKLMTKSDFKHTALLNKEEKEHSEMIEREPIPHRRSVGAIRREYPICSLFDK